MEGLVIISIAVGLAFCVGFFVGRISAKVDGLFIVDDTGETTRWILDVKTDPDKIQNKKEVRLKVGKFTQGDV